MAQHGPDDHDDDDDNHDDNHHHHHHHRFTTGHYCLACTNWNNLRCGRPPHAERGELFTPQTGSFKDPIVYNSDYYPNWSSTTHSDSAQSSNIKFSHDSSWQVDITLGPNPDESVANWLLHTIFSLCVYVFIYYIYIYTLYIYILYIYIYIYYMHKYDYMYPCIIMCNYILYNIQYRYTLLILKYSIRTLCLNIPTPSAIARCDLDSGTPARYRRGKIRRSDSMTTLKASWRPPAGSEWRPKKERNDQPIWRWG